MTEWEKMERGLWYDANNDAQLLQNRVDVDELCCRLNQTPLRKAEEREKLLDRLLPHRGDNTTILSPLYVDYGVNCYIGDGTFINRSAYLMDCATITIGCNCFIGPNCGMYTACHPLVARERDLGLEKAEPITVGDHVWIGADVTILPGVTIGENTVIGAGSVVSKDIPGGVVAVGNPCRVLRKITEQDGIRDQLCRERGF